MSSLFRHQGEEQKNSHSKMNQRLFVIEDGRDTDIALNIDSQNGDSILISRCDKCGFPIQHKMATDKEIVSESSEKMKVCFICRRVSILNGILILSYIVTAILFIASIIAVIFDFLTFDLSLLFGCLEIIFLLFFGRFLEEAIYFGLPQEQRVIAALYQFTNSGDIQGYDIAYRYLKKIELTEISSEFYLAIYHVLLFQTTNVPYYFFSDMSNQLGISIQEFINKMISKLEPSINFDYLKKIFTRVPPPGFSLTTSLFLNSNHHKELGLILDNLSGKIEQEKLDSKWLRELFINGDLFIKAANQLSLDSLMEEINSQLALYNPPKVPTIDVIEGSKKLMRNPLIRYLLRIAFYIALAFLLGLIYQLINKL